MVKASTFTYHTVQTAGFESAYAALCIFGPGEQQAQDEAGLSTTKHKLSLFYWLQLLLLSLNLKAFHHLFDFIESPKRIGSVRFLISKGSYFI